MATAGKRPTTTVASRSTTRGDRIENPEGAVRIARKGELRYDPSSVDILPEKVGEKN